MGTANNDSLAIGEAVEAWYEVGERSCEQLALDGTNEVNTINGGSIWRRCDGDSLAPTQSSSTRPTEAISFVKSPPSTRVQITATARVANGLLQTPPLLSFHLHRFNTAISAFPRKSEMKSLGRILRNVPKWADLVGKAGRVYPSVAQPPLPKAPVPDLESTLSKYLDYAKVIAVAKQTSIANTERAVQKFASEGLSIQRQLEKIADDQPNWVNLFWLPEMYLSVRLALPVNTNPAYIFPQQTFKTRKDQIDYAACLVRGICDFKEAIDKKTIVRDVSTGRDKVRMCMDQYDRLFATHREPGHPLDRHHETQLADNGGNEHIVVLCNKQMYILRTKLGDEQLSRAEIAHQLDEIMRTAPHRDDCSTVAIGAATAGDRSDAAELRRLLMEDPSNANYMQWIRSASFVLCLDRIENPTKWKNNVENNMASRAHHLLHGYGSDYFGLNRWYDATIQVIVSSDGTNGLCIQHSVAEGIVIINMAEKAIKYVQEQLHRKQVTPASRLLQPKPLVWHVGSREMELLEKLKQQFDGLALDLDMQIMNFTEFGKNLPKANQISPDGFVQLAMQLAYFKKYGHLVSTYESAAIRRFRSGRVDNIRAATPEALAWVQSMASPGTPANVRRKKFDLAVERQATVTLENITGYGIDNHLCALRTLARDAVADGKLEQMPELFSDPLFDELMRFPLSTSQVTTSIDDTFLCYGPVVQDGYGCAYNLLEEHIIFAVSAFKSCAKTDSQAYKEAIRQSLIDMRGLLAESS